MDGFELVGTTMVVSTDLDLDAEEGFKEAAEQLISCEGSPLYLDLSQVGFIGSAFFGQMFLMNYKIRKAGRELILKVPQRLLSVMELLGLPQLLEVQVVDDQRDA